MSRLLELLHKDFKIKSGVTHSRRRIFERYSDIMDIFVCFAKYKRNIFEKDKK
jgi:hypothetical protein